MVLDSLNCSDGAIGAAAQGWLIRALSLSDVARILEPILLLLLHPRTQRTSISYIKHRSSPGTAAVALGALTEPLLKGAAFPLHQIRGFLLIQSLE